VSISGWDFIGKASSKKLAKMEAASNALGYLHSIKFVKHSLQVAGRQQSSINQSKGEISEPAVHATPTLAVVVKRLLVHGNRNRTRSMLGSKFDSSII